ncbi:MAG: S8 family serine peptidase [Candidatus Bathyarchaeota archaeon]|nr:S8 family serine peptidase [Candidatus Bathyarchaeota archaeon]MDH5779149.1 S8 family serine peptidase [Candidatus Bathyarchaeota archaeon]
MKKTTIVLILALLVFATIPIVTSSTEPSFDLPFDVMMFREELDCELETGSLIASESLSEATPFWVDMVDADVREDGEGVFVAVLDTGLLEMWPYFFSQANIAWELGKGFTHDIWWNPSGYFEFGPLDDTRGFITKPFEGSGHGTHVTSTIVGYNYADLFWVRGVAPKATIIPVLVLDAWLVPYPGGTAFFRGGTDEMVSAGIYYVTELAEELDGPVIISMSLGGDEPSPMIEEAIDYAIKKGVIVVVAAGNVGYAGMDWPGAYPQVISCAMAGWTEQFLQYPGTRWWKDNDVPEKLNTPDYYGNNWHLFLDDLSSRPNKDLGQKKWHLDVATPGSAILGPYKPYLSPVIGYYYVWGTSMATPHVSGMAALVLESYPSFGQATMEAILKNAANVLPVPSDGSWAYDPWYGVYHFEWFGIDWGSGFLQADTALFVAWTRSRARTLNGAGKSQIDILS